MPTSLLWFEPQHASRIDDPRNFGVKQVPRAKRARNPVGRGRRRKRPPESLDLEGSTGQGNGEQFSPCTNLAGKGLEVRRPLSSRLPSACFPAEGPLNFLCF